MYASHAADDADIHILIGSREHLSAILLIYFLGSAIQQMSSSFPSSLKVSGSERGKLFLRCQAR